MDILSSLPGMAGAVTRQISAENPTGEKGGACAFIPDPTNPDLPFSKAAMDLGKGWKVRPFVPLEAGKTLVLADIEGPGIINQIFLTSDAPRLSELTLRIYWDEEETPSVETPMGAFYCMGFDNFPHTVSSMPITVAPHRGMSCYWQMPFRRHAKLTLTNEGAQNVNVVAYRVLYKLCSVDSDAAYFHAQYRRKMSTADNPEHVILDNVRGKGLYVGTYLMYNVSESGWWGEGEVKFFIDGDTDQPTLCDNGTEDYFGGAWSFGAFQGPDTKENCFESPFLGMPLAVYENRGGPRKFGLYRFHLYDSIGFASDLRVTVQLLGWYPNGTFRPLCDDIGSVAYWYQQEPHETFPALPDLKNRWDR
ncbi:MAG: DUF2961 domain-containing protein [Clostridia bacterium]|nr:DUF2961 domain-containing protein [Clostridia bacterium]